MGLDALALRLAAAKQALAAVEAKQSIGAGFVSFAERVLQLSLTKAQKIAADVAFDGKASEGDLAKRIFGFNGPVPQSARRVFVAVCGRASAKTSVFLAARAIHLALTVNTDSLGAGEPAYIPIVAPDIRLARQTLSFVRGLIARSSYLSSMVVSDGQELVRIRKPDGREVRIECLPATSGGKGVRGRSLACFALEESAFFQGEGFEVNDKDIFDSAMPRLLPGGQALIVSSPWARSGLLWELYRDNFGHPRSAICLHAPTQIMREDTSDVFSVLNAEIEQQRAVDPDRVRREFDAEFLEADAELFFPQQLLDACTDEMLSVPCPCRSGDTVKFGADFGFQSDSCALVGVIEREGTLMVSEVCELRPSKDAPLAPSAVVTEFSLRVKVAGGSYVMADGHYREAIQEHLTRHALFMVDAPTMVSQPWVITRALMQQGRLRLPKNGRLLTQLSRVRVVARPGGLLSIQQPRTRDGGHGDVASAFALAAFQAGGNVVKADTRPKTLVEAEKRQLDELRAARLKKIEDEEKARASRIIRASARWARGVGNVRGFR